MRKFLTIALAFSLSTSGFADCDFSKDVVKNADGSYTYSKDCHIEVGRMVQETAKQKESIGKLAESLTMKDLVIDKANERVTLYQTAAFKLEDRVELMEKTKNSERILWVIIGAASMAVAVWGAGQLR